MLKAMSFARTLLTLILAFAFVGYGVTANAPAHAHGAHDFHALHAVAVDAHGHGYGEPADAGAHHDEDPDDVSNADHHETGLHSHSVSQFNQTDLPSFLIALAMSGSATMADLASLPALRRDSPPFKPPRSFR